ncbi:cell division initiation protein [Embleya sp. NBC_00896]|uniref:cell division initiation protein n=1 Tax=Embleya sp. NBC_00896 TaxID=2975961 RepID=UPI00386979E9|nr:cell division initiation protein [Embleya sp. NBC_00896]
MDVQPKLDELIALVENARSMPMSASCVVNRADVVARLEELKNLLPEEFNHARRVLGDRESVIEEGRREAERVLANAREERGSLIADTEVAREAYGEADRILNEARREAQRIREEADDYVDQKLANFEVVLTKTLGAIGRGRDKMRGRRPSDELGEYMQAQELADAQAKGRPGSLQAQLDGHEDDFAAPQPEYPPAPAAPPIVPAQAGPYDQGYAQDPYGQPAYAQQGNGADNGYGGGYEAQYDMPGYGQQGQQAYDPARHVPAQHDPAGTGQQPAYDPQAQYAQSLDETSFFDTSLIDVRQFQQDGGR